MSGAGPARQQFQAEQKMDQRQKVLGIARGVPRVRACRSLGYVRHAVIDFIVDNSYSLEYGAREVKRFIKREVTAKIASCKLGEARYSKFKSLFKDGELFIEGEE